MFSNNEKILLALSGGVDSMVLADLILKLDLGLIISIAHFNHLTRGAASKSDEEFVQEFASSRQLKFYSSSLSSKTTNNNFHAEARAQRYQFFRSLGYDKILTAHHKDDQVETLLINLINGRSIELIPEVNDNIVRPLMPFTKQEIETYAARHQISYVVDESNAENKYLRNALRNKILPELAKKKIDRFKMLQVAKRAFDTSSLLMDLIEEQIPLKDHKKYISIGKSDLLKIRNPLMLFLRIKKFGFTMSQAEDILNNSEATGRLFDSNGYVALKDRGSLYIKERQKKLTDPYVIALDNIPNKFEFLGHKFSLRYCKESSQESKNVVLLPIEYIVGNLKFRTWVQGDRFQPSGMNGQSQTIKKFFANARVNLFDKETTPILEDAQGIVWVAGMRKDCRFEVKPNHTKFLEVTLLS